MSGKEKKGSTKDRNEKRKRNRESRMELKNVCTKKEEVEGTRTRQKQTVLMVCGYSEFN
jgi:hypothetical protein